MKFLLNCLCIMTKLYKSCFFKSPLSMLQKYVQIAVCAIDRKQRRKSMGGVFVGLPIINISWSTNTIHAQIQLEKQGDLLGVPLPISIWAGCVSLCLYMCNRAAHMMVIFNVNLRDTLALLESVFLLAVYICLIYSLLQTGLYWTLFCKRQHNF